LDITDQIGSILVPTTITPKIGESNSIDLTFPVLWESNDAVGANVFTGVLTVTVTSIKINGVDYSHLFTVDVVSGDGAITEDLAQNLIINVEFTNEPSTSAEYMLVAGQPLVITLTFVVVPN